MYKLLFLTSNRTKFQHARYLCRKYEIDIVSKSIYGVAYNEPRTPDRDKLFEECIEDAKKRLFKQTHNKTISETQETTLIDTIFENIPLSLNKLFFIEDTSVQLHTLSNSSEEIPGTDIKYWMKEHDFKSVDKLLREHGNDRRVTVRSDILLYLPKNLRENQIKDYKRFKSEESGSFTEIEYNFATNELYPWLDNQSFNKWFIPNGCKRPISMLSIKEADKHDFRVGAFRDMLEFLEKEKIITKINHKKKKQTQKVLSFFDIPVFLLCGLPCAGKTTLGKYLSKYCGYYHIEASDFMYLSYYERHGINPTIKIPDFAEKALKDNPAIVADQIITHLTEIKEVPFIITGFRAPDEIEIFLKKYRGPNTLFQVYVEANFQERYKRNVIRNREGDIGSEKDFRNRDKQQLRMGLKEIKKKLKSATILNNSSISSYCKDFLKKYTFIPQYSNSELNFPKERPTELEDAILISLLDENKYFTTTEIAHHINDFFPNSKINTNKNNVSRYFNQKFHPYYEIKLENNKIKYRLSPSGRSRAMLILNCKKY